MNFTNSTQYDARTLADLKEYSEDFEKLSGWLDSVELAIVKTGHGPAEHVKNGYRFSYLVTIRRNGKECQFPYYGSVNDYNYETMQRDNRAFGMTMMKNQPSKPSPIVYSVLACIGSDYYCPDSHHDFCSEYGYDEDSIKALSLFTECQKLARSLRTVITAEEIGAFPS